MSTVLAFVLTLAILIVVHEYGHYRVARACGVKVLRFSVGFGRVIWRHQRSPGIMPFTDRIMRASPPFCICFMTFCICSNWFSKRLTS